MRFHHAFFAVFIFMGLQSCSQTNRIVKQDVAFRSVRNAGTIAIDDNGNQISNAADTVFVVYLETTSNDVIWERAEYNGTDYSIAFTIAAERPVIIGVKKETGERLQFNPATGNTVWKLELVSGKPGLSNTVGGVVLKGKINNTPFVYTVKKLTEVLLPDSY